MDHPAGAQAEPVGRHRLAGGELPAGGDQLVRGPLQLGPGRSRDRARHSPAVRERRVRGVDDRVDVLRRDVGLNYLDPICHGEVADRTR